MLPEVAGSAGRDHVANAVAATTRDRNDVIHRERAGLSAVRTAEPVPVQGPLPVRVRELEGLGTTKARLPPSAVLPAAIRVLGEVAARILAPMATLCGVAFAVPLAGTAVVATTAIRRTGLALPTAVDGVRALAHHRPVARSAQPDRGSHVAAARYSSMMATFAGSTSGSPPRSSSRRTRRRSPSVTSRRSKAEYTVWSICAGRRSSRSWAFLM